MKTNTLTQSFFLSCCLISTSLASIQAQMQTRKPASAAFAAEGCLACPGSEWSNYNRIKKKDGHFATTYLTNESYCFQTVCYFSRGLIASDFQFLIPQTAVITGIRVGVVRKADTAGSIYDLTIQLLKDNIPSGDNKSATAPWPVSSNPKLYGNVSDTWGLSLTPDDVNSSDFGFWLQCQNLTESYSCKASVDFVRMTVYYSDGEKMYEQTSEAGDITSLDITPNPLNSSATITFSSEKDTHAILELYDLAGKKIITIFEENISAGEHRIAFAEVDDIPVAGIYLIQLKMNGEIITKKVMIAP